MNILLVVVLVLVFGVFGCWMWLVIGKWCGCDFVIGFGGLFLFYGIGGVLVGVVVFCFLVVCVFMVCGGLWV